MNSGGSNNVNWKYERYASSGCWDIGFIKLGFVAKTQFHSIQFQCLKLVKGTFGKVKFPYLPCQAAVNN